MKTRILLVPVAATMLLGAACNRSSADKEAAMENPAITAADVSGQAEEAVQTAAFEGSETQGTIKLTKADFLARVMNYEVNQEEWVFEGDKPCIIDFYADWCAPCRMTSPILEELAVEYGDKINIYRVDTDREQELAAVFGIQNIPSFLFCPMEGMPVMSSGIAQTKEQTKEMFRQQIDEYLLKQQEL